MLKVVKSNINQSFIYTDNFILGVKNSINFEAEFAQAILIKETVTYSNFIWFLKKMENWLKSDNNFDN